MLRILYVVPLLLGASQRTAAQAWRFLLICCGSTLLNLLVPLPVHQNLASVLIDRLLVCLSLVVTTGHDIKTPVLGTLASLSLLENGAVVEAIRSSQQRCLRLGASWWDQKATAALQRFVPAHAIAAANQSERLDGLTQREREVLACLAAGDNNRAIAQRLCIGEGTVRSHVHLLLQKLQVHNRTQAALIWLTAGKDGHR